MKNKKYILFTLFFIFCFSLISCEITKKENNIKTDVIKEENVEGKNDSTYMSNILKNVSLITGDGYKLQMNSYIFLKENTLSINGISDVDNLLKNIKTFKTSLENISISEDQTISKEDLINALDKYSTSLENYKEFLSQENISKEELDEKVNDFVNDIYLIEKICNIPK